MMNRQNRKSRSLCWAAGVLWVGAVGWVCAGQEAGTGNGAGSRTTVPELPQPVLSGLPDGRPPGRGELVGGDMLRGDLAAAEASARSAVERQPKSAAALYLLGEVLMRRNKAEESLAIMTQAAALRTPTGTELRVVGLDYILLDDTTDAIRWLTEAVRASGGDPEIWYSLGRAQYTKGTFAAAETSFRRSLALDPRSAKAEDNLGLTLAAQNRNDEALAAYTRSIADGPMLPASEQPWLNRGTLLLHLGQTAAAVPDLLQAVKLAPKCAVCHETAGQALLGVEGLPEARAEMEQATALEPQNPRFHYELGRLYKRLGESKLSEEELKRSQQMYGTKSTPVQ